jgi:hypothetical protein
VDRTSDINCQQHDRLRNRLSHVVSDSYPKAGAALDLAGGIGRHALWLADKRWQMSTVDISEVAITRLSQEALQLNLALDLFALDATVYKFERPSTI